VQAWADASLRRFAYEWNRYFRGELPVKNDTAVTEEDQRRYNMILFGDPGSNCWITRALPELPIQWTPSEVRLANKSFPAANHVPVLIFPNPMAKTHYVVLNTGHTFHEKELGSLNYLLFPRLGDWALLQISDQVPKTPSEPLADRVLHAGFFDEHWKLPKPLPNN
jgi:hypothetical protein